MLCDTFFNGRLWSWKFKAIARNVPTCYCLYSWGHWILGYAVTNRNNTPLPFTSTKNVCLHVIRISWFQCQQLQYGNTSLTFENACMICCRIKRWVSLWREVVSRLVHAWHISRSDTSLFWRERVLPEGLPRRGVPTIFLCISPVCSLLLSCISFLLTDNPMSSLLSNPFFQSVKSNGETSNFSWGVLLI